MKKLLVVTCSGFTTIVLLFALLSGAGIVPALSGPVVIELFFMALSISAGMLVIEKVEEVYDSSSFILDFLMRMVLCYIVVMLEGHLFKMVTLDWTDFINVSLVLIPTIIVTYLLSFIQLRELANSINRELDHRTKRERGE